jgi:hypothetical protein
MKIEYSSKCLGFFVRLSVFTVSTTHQLPRSENNQLSRISEQIRETHEKLSKENEFLARKLERFLNAQGSSANELIGQNMETNDVEKKTFPKINKSQVNSVRSGMDHKPGENTNKCVSSKPVGANFFEKI